MDGKETLCIARRPVRADQGLFDTVGVMTKGKSLANAPARKDLP
jgi:hypothetical protein